MLRAVHRCACKLLSAAGPWWACAANRRTAAESTGTCPGPNWASCSGAVGDLFRICYLQSQLLIPVPSAPHVPPTPTDIGAVSEREVPLVALKIKDGEPLAPDTSQLPLAARLAKPRVGGGG